MPASRSSTRPTSTAGPSSETYLGAALGARRDEIVLATKFGVPYEGHEGGASAAYVRTGGRGQPAPPRHRPHRPLPAALPRPKDPDRRDPRCARTSWWPRARSARSGAPTSTLAMLEEAAAATPAGRPGFVSVQNQYNILYREPEDGVLAECERTGVAFLPFFPLANGLLSGKYRARRARPRGHPPGRDGRAGGRPAERRAARHGRRPRRAGAAKRPQRARPGLRVAAVAARVASVIAGATRPEQVAANVAAGAVAPG